MLRNCVWLSVVVVSLSTLASAGTIVAPINKLGDLGFSLQQVIAAGGIQVGDKVFDLFSVDNSFPTGDGPGLDDIRVYGVQINGELGLRFIGGWSAVRGEELDTVIGFRVTANSPWLISDNSLGMDNFDARNGGLVSITENVFAAEPRPAFGGGPAPFLASKSVFYANRAEKNLLDHEEYSDEYRPVAFPQVWVTKDITVKGGSCEGGFAGLSQFYQTFSQIPEPASMALLALGGLMVLARKNRRG